jgi:outer membrane receptor for ferrienterochelin and colicins
MRSFLIFLFLFYILSLHSQSIIDGHVYDKDDRPIDGAMVYHTALDLYTLSDDKGYFVIPIDTVSYKSGSFIVSRIGYKPDTLYALLMGHYDFYLEENASIKTVTVKGRKAGTYNPSTIQQLEIITSEELTKSACCDLAGCFNTQASVQVNTTNQLTNAKELRLLGISGVYNQILVEGMPLFIGNSLTYGISQLSGPMINSIMVAKGTTSILQGFDAISGQINVILKKYDQMEPLLFNAYGNNFGETQFNVNQRTKAGPFKVCNSLHFALPGRRMDLEGDGFLNMPLTRRLSLYQTWEYGNTDKDGYASVSGIWFTQENRTGGQVEYDYRQDLGSDKIYGQHVDIFQPSIFTKHYYKWNNRSGIGFNSSFQYHQQNSWMGLLHYKSDMQHSWSSFQYENRYGHNNLIKAGLSFRYFNSQEEININPEDTLRTYGGIYNKFETIPGIFAENILEAFDHKLSLITGIRFDYHSQYNWLVTPRFLLKYEFTDGWTYRLSGGNGYRTFNTFSDYSQIISSNRNLRISGGLNPELAYTTGNSLNYQVDKNQWNFQLGGDFYFTWFKNQIFPDFDGNPLLISLNNDSNGTRSISAQIDAKAIFDQWLEGKISYSYLDVSSRKDEERVTLPFIQKHRFSAAFSIRPENSPFFLDLNIHYNGSQRLPDPEFIPEPYSYNINTPAYTLLNAQITYKNKKFDWYLGCENITGFYQSFPLRAWEDPFGPYFDVTTVWGPTRGREWYTGVRYFIKNEN